MTLFRKVFQNQARPIDKSKAIDEDAMASAFDAVRQGADPFVLEQDAHAVPERNTDAAELTRPSDGSGAPDDGSDDFEDVQLDDTATDPEKPEVAGLLETLNPPDEVAGEVTSQASAPISNGPQTDQEIAAFMDRTIAAETASTDEDSDAVMDGGLADELEFSLPSTPGGSTESDQADVRHDNAAEDILDDLDAALSNDPHPSNPAVDRHAGAPSDATAARQDTADEADLSGDMLREAAPKPAVVAAAETDVSSFARQQMVGIAEAQPSQATNVADAPVAKDAPDAHDDNAVPSSDEGAAAPELDLSGGLAPVPSAGRAGRRAGRVKTRLLGFNREEEATDPLGQVAESTAIPQREKFPVGWLVVVEGPGVGHAFSIFTGASMIGRGEDQVIRLDFGDNSISRHNHAAIAYDEEANKFYVGHGGKSNIIRRNARPVLSTEELHHADLLRIGETTLRFVALCGSDFQWNRTGGSDATGV